MGKRGEEPLWRTCAWAFGCPVGIVIALVLISITGTALGWWP